MNTYIHKHTREVIKTRNWEISSFPNRINVVDKFSGYIVSIYVDKKKVLSDDYKVSVDREDRSRVYIKSDYGDILFVVMLNDTIEIFFLY